MHPGFDFSEAVGQSGVSYSSDGFSTHVELDVVAIAVEMETMMTDDVTKEKHVEDEKERTKHQTLGDTLGQRSVGGGAIIDADELLAVCDI